MRTIRYVATMSLTLLAGPACAYTIIDGSSPSFDVSDRLLTTDIIYRHFDATVEFRNLHNGKEPRSFCGEMSIVGPDGTRTRFKKVVFYSQPPFLLNDRPLEPGIPHGESLIFEPGTPLDGLLPLSVLAATLTTSCRCFGDSAHI